MQNVFCLYLYVYIFIYIYIFNNRLGHSHASLHCALSPPALQTRYHHSPLPSFNVSCVHTSHGHVQVLFGINPRFLLLGDQQHQNAAALKTSAIGNHIKSTAMTEHVTQGLQHNKKSPSAALPAVLDWGHLYAGAGSAERVCARRTRCACSTRTVAYRRVAAGGAHATPRR